jgi:catechol 2,3-dioxygenase
MTRQREARMEAALQDRPAGHPQSATHPVAVAGVSLAVRDLDSVVAFYREAVGLELLGLTENAAQLGAGGVAFLELLHRPDLLPRDKAAAGLYHTALLLPSRADLGRWLAHAARLGLLLDGAADHLVSEAVYLHDPEGNGVEIYADRPRAEWRWDGGQVRMANDRLDMIGLRALATDPWTAAPTGTRIGHVHLQVGDIEAAERFYAGLLGFDVTKRGPKALFMSTGGYHHHLAANTWESAGAGQRDPARAGLAAVTLRAASEAVLEGVMQRGVVQGAGPIDPAAGVRDPWGIPIRFHVQPEGELA